MGKNNRTMEEEFSMKSSRNYRDCQADGTWSNAVPICEAQVCPSPPIIKKGHFNPVKDEYVYLDTVIYSCDVNLALIGESSISCKEDGKWSSAAPVCKEIQCRSPNVPHSVKRSGFSGPYYLNSAITFSCFTDYVMNGSGIIRCNEMSKWEPEPPKCLGVCKNLPSIAFAELEEPTREKNFVEGTTLTFKCKEGYEHIPGKKNTATCLGKHWDARDLFCKSISCQKPEPINNGIMTAESYLYGSTATYKCNNGYNIKDGNTRKCQANGIWSLPVPECEVQTCPTPNMTMGIEYSPVKQQYQYEDKITFTCQEGYQLIGEPTITCNSEGSWSQCQPICKVQTCPTPNMTTEIEYSPVKPQYQYEDKITFICQEGYQLIGEPTITCNSEGAWSPRQPICKIQTCPPPEFLTDGSYSIKKEIYIYQESVTYMCNNLTVVGEALVSCTAEGNWTSGAPECKAVCKTPPVLDYAQPEKEYIKQLYFDIYTTVKYECRPGFLLEDKKNPTVTCLENNKWSEPEIFCKRLSCGPPASIDHGKVENKDDLFGTRAYYKCNPGYNMISTKHYRECQATGTWSSDLPVCKESICDKIWELQEEARMCTSTPDEWLKYLQVQYFYLQIENLKLDIKIKKKQLDDEA